jgi:CheY-like chemotaxis protein
MGLKKPACAVNHILNSSLLNQTPMEEDKRPVINKAPVKITLADHDKVDIENFQEAIEKAHVNADVTIVDNGQELMDNLQDATQPNPDIIFLDMDMPLKDGKECLKEMQNDEGLKDIPTVIYSASNSEKDIDDAFKSGANLYLPKPVFFRNLVRLIKKIFMINWKQTLLNPLRENFLLSEESVSDRPAAKGNH